MPMEDVDLPWPTNATSEGPIFNSDGTSLAVTYDYQTEDGISEWTKVSFAEAIAFSYQQNVCCTAEEVIPSRVIRQYDDSEWLSSTVARWEKSVGWQGFQSQSGGGSRFRHFQVFFDDVGCLGVIASSCRIERILP